MRELLEVGALMAISSGALGLTLPRAFVMLALAAIGSVAAYTTHVLELKAPGQSFSPHVEHLAVQTAT